MSRLLTRARGYLADAGRGFQRAPVEVALALFIAVTFSWSVAIGGDAFPAWLEIAVPAVLVLAFAWTGTLLHALGAIGARTRWIITVAGALLVAVYAQWVVDFDRGAEGVRAAVLVLAAVLWLLAVPALGAQGDAVERMRRVDGRILLRLLGVGLYGVALYLGLALALAAVNSLFELKLDGKIYAHVAGWIHFVLVPWVVLGGLDDYVRPPEATSAVASAVQRITLFLVPPLLALYLLILYAYVVRIALTGELPKNLVSPMVLAAGALTAVALLLFDPPPRTGGLARALRLAPALFLPLAPLGVWALLVRIDQYGWTEFRALRVVALAAFTALAVGATVQLVRRRPFALHVLPITLAAAAILAVVGPWSTLALSRRDQQARLVAALDSVATLPVDTAAPPPRDIDTRRMRGPAPLMAEDSAIDWRVVSADLYDRILSGARYLHSTHGPDALPAQLAQAAEGRPPWEVNYATVLGLRRAPDRDAPRDESVYRFLPLEAAVPLEGATAYRIDYRPPSARGPGARSTIVSVQGQRLVLMLPAGTLYADLAPLFAAGDQPAARPEGNDLPTAGAVLPVVDAEGRPRGQVLVFETTLGAGTPGGRLQHIAGVVLVRE